MPRGSRYIFCHYRMSVDDEDLDGTAQLQLLSEVQGNEFDYGRVRQGVQPSALAMAPAAIDIDGVPGFTFWVGYRPGVRTRVTYDSARRVIGRTVEQDDHIKSTHVVAVPRLRVLAIEDRAGDENIPALAGLRALRAIVRSFGDGQGELDIVHVTDADVRRALDEWALTEYMYTVRPLNPINHTDRAERRSEAYKAEGIGKESGRVWPMEGQTMEPNDGVIAETRDLVDVGYGQNGLRGLTPEGHEAHIPKPPFHMERQRNLAERDKPRLLRVLIEPDEAGTDTSLIVGRALVGFYG